MAKSGCYRNECRRWHIHCVVLHRHWHLAAEGDAALVHISTLLCYGYETIPVNLPASVLDTINFMSKTSCAIEYHNVITLCGKVRPFVHLKSVAWLDFIWFHSLYHRKWWWASTAFTSFLKPLKFSFLSWWVQTCFVFPHIEAILAAQYFQFQLSSLDLTVLNNSSPFSVFSTIISVYFRVFMTGLSSSIHFSRDTSDCS